MHNTNIPCDVLYIIDTLNKNGYEAYIVGGCVRDMILKRNPNDWDITTSAKPYEIKKCFKKTFDTGIKHGTVTVVINKKNYEVTTYRIDGEYTDFRRPDEIFFTNKLSDDILRRDFTINAIAYHQNEGYIDYFGGIYDIKNNIIRGVGNPYERFNEDALRMLRAIRFSVQLGFDIDYETLLSLRKNVHLIKKISIERIREEITKLLNGDFIEKMPILWESGLLYEISNVLYNNLIEQKQYILKALNFKPKNTTICWSIFLKGFDEQNTIKMLRYFKFDVNTIKKVSKLVSNIDCKFPENDYEIKKCANIFGNENIMNYFKLYSYLYDYEKGKHAQKRYNLIIKNNECIFQKDMKINGNDLIEIGFNKGKKIGDVLYNLLDLVHKNPNTNKKEILLMEAKKYI